MCSWPEEVNTFVHICSRPYPCTKHGCDFERLCVRSAEELIFILVLYAHDDDDNQVRYMHLCGCRPACIVYVISLRFHENQRAQFSKTQFLIYGKKKIVCGRENVGRTETGENVFS